MIAFITVTISALLGGLAFIASLPFTACLTILGAASIAALAGVAVIGAPVVLGGLLTGGGLLAAIASVVTYLIFGDGAVPGELGAALAAWITSL